MVIHDSVVEAALLLKSERQRIEFLGVVALYLATGEEPKNIEKYLSNGTLVAFVSLRQLLDNSRSRAVSGSAGGKKSAASKRASKSGSKTARKQKQKEKDISNESNSYSLSPTNKRVGEGAEFVPPTTDEARAYFEANCLSGDPEEFVNHFAAQGWVRGNGVPVADWHPLAMSWSSNERRRDAERAASLKGGRGDPEYDQSVRDMAAKYANVPVVPFEEMFPGGIGAVDAQ